MNTQQAPTPAIKAHDRTPLLATLPGLVAGCLVCCLLWGSAFPCVKIGYELFQIAADDTASRLVFAGARFILAGCMVVVGISAAQRKPLAPHKEDVGAVLLLALFQTILQYFFFYGGLSRAAGLTSSIIEAAANFFAILFAAFLFKTEHMTSKKLLGCIVGFCGVVLINMGGGSAGSLSFSLSGEGFIFMSTIAGAMSTCLIAVLGKRHDSVMLSGWQFVIGGGVLLGAGIAMGGHLDPVSLVPALGLLTYMAFISAMAYSLWSRLLAVNPVSRVSIFGFMNPVFGAVLSAIFLGEASLVSPILAVVSLALVSAGIIVVNR